jgi:hypothetical protein
MQTLVIQVSDDDESWWSLMPDLILTPEPVTSFSAGLQNLVDLQLGTLSSGLNFMLSLRLMLLPNLRKLGLTSVNDPLVDEWSMEDQELLAPLYGTSTVEDFTLTECYHTHFWNLFHFLKLPKVLRTLDFDVGQDTSFSALKDHLLHHRDTLQTLTLSSSCGEDIDAEPLGDLGAFRVLRSFEGDLQALATESTSIAMLLPPSIESLQLVLCWGGERAMDENACSRQLLEVVQKCPRLTELFIIGPAEIGRVVQRIEDECAERRVELKVRSWDSG